MTRERARPARRGRSRVATLCAVALTLAGAAVPVRGAATDIALADAIEGLRARGLRVLYSSDLIKPGMRARVSDVRDADVATLRSLLADHPLVAVPGPQGTWLVIAERRDDASDPARAAAATGAGQPGALEEIVVTASRYAFRLAPALPGTLLAADLDILPALGDDPLRALARTASFGVSDHSARPRVRAGRDDEAAIVYDDVPLYDPYHLKDARGTFSAIDPAIVDRIDVYAAVHPARFGERMSGVIEIHPYRPASPFEGQVSASVFNAGLRAGGAAASGAGWLVAARRGTVDAWLGAVEPRLGRPRYWDGLARGTVALAPGVRLAANVLAFEDAVRLNDIDSEERARSSARDRYAWIDLHATAAPGADWRLRVARVQLDRRRYGEADQEGLVRGEVRTAGDARQHSVGLEARWGPWAEPAAYAGAEWREFRADATLGASGAFDVLLRTPFGVRAAALDARATRRDRGHHWSAFAGGELGRGTRLRAELGLRVEGRSDVGAPTWSPRLSLLGEITPDVRVRLGAAALAQYEPLDALLVAGTAMTGRTPRARHLVAGVEIGRCGLDLRVEGFLKRYGGLAAIEDNLLNEFVLLPELKPDRLVVPLERARVHGIEFALASPRDAAFRWHASYAWTRATDEAAAVRFRRAGVREHRASVRVLHRADAWEWSADADWASGAPTSEIGFDASTEPPTALVRVPGTRRLRAFASVDARVVRRMRLGGRGVLSAWVQVNNLFDRRNACCAEIQVESVDGVDELAVEVVHTAPRFPSAGITYSW